MALATRQSQLLHGDNVRLGRTVDTVVDEQTGFAAQRERVMAAVPDQHGNVIVMVQERIRAVRVPQMIGSSIGREDPALLTAAPEDKDDSGLITLCDFCCLPYFLSCLSSKIFLGLFACLVLIPSIILVAITAAGPIQCAIPYNTTSNNTTASPAALTVPPSPATLIVPASGVTIALIGVILFILLLCFCIQCFTGDDCGACRGIVYCCNCLAIILLLALIVAGSVLAFMSDTTSNPNCKFPVTPIATVAFSYAFTVLTCCCWVLCCCAIIGSKARD